MNFKYYFILIFISFQLQSQNNNQSIGFIENKGQIIDQKGRANNAVKYLLNTNGLNIQLRKNGFSYDIYDTKKHPLSKKQLEKQHPISSLQREIDKTPDYKLEYIYHRIDIDFVNSNKNVVMIAEEKSSDYDNYYNIPNKPEGITDVHKFQRITYKNIYPNIDVVFFIPENQSKPVEYNFVIHPNGKISDIQMKFNGAKTDLIENKIKMSTRFGEMEETLPLSWIEAGNDKNVVGIGYTKIKKDIYGFKTNENLVSKKVVIDPVPIRLWGTYYGGESGESPSSIFVKDGFVYWAGITYSTNNIASVGAHQINFASGWDYDCFFAKLNSDGTRVWGTYCGGDRADGIAQIKVSNNDNIYIAGGTLSNENISTPGSHQSISGNTPPGATWNGFLAKFDNSGIRQWGTYYGDLGYDYIHCLVVDKNEKIYIAGETNSDKNIATNGTHQPNLNESKGIGYDAFITKFDSNGVLEWGTYFGGSNFEAIYDCKIDSSGNNIIFLGFTASDSNIATPGSFQENNVDGDMDGFLVKFDFNGNRIWGTYFGGDDYDDFFDLGIDANDNLYCFGRTISELGIATPGVYQENYIQTNLYYSGCIFKLNSNGFKIWGSYFFPETLGGSVSKSGDIYFAGRVENDFFPTPNAYQEINYGGTESYFVKFNTNGQREWATYFGGDAADNAHITSVDDDSYIYLSGSTNSTNNIATKNTYQPNVYPPSNWYTPNGSDAFLVKFKDCTATTTAKSNSPICIGKNLELTASGGTNYSWTGPNGFTSTEQNPIILNPSNLNSGQYSCAITGTSDCDNTITIDVLVGDTLAPIPDLTTLPTITGDCNTIISTIPTATDNCAGSIQATTLNPLSYSLPGSYTILWNYDDGNGNTVTQEQIVTITVQPLPSVLTPQTFCIDQNATINDIAITGQNLKFYDSFTGGNLLPVNTSLQNGITYYASQTINGCESLRVPVLTNIQNTPIPTGNQNQSFCATQNATLNSIEVIATDLKWYATKTSSTALPTSTILVDGAKYFVTQTINGCESVDRFEVSIALISTLNATNYAAMLCDDLNDGFENINLIDYNSKLITATAEIIFTYYSSVLGAENENPSDKINSNYKLTLGSHTIYVRIDSNNGCRQIVTLALELVAKPILSINDIVPICEGKPITVAAGIGADSYLWSTGATTQSIIISFEGEYSVTAIKNHGATSCSSTKEFSVKNSQTATIKNIEIKDWTTNDNQIIVYTTETGDFEYSINGTNFQDSNQFSNLPSGDYTVTVRDKFGCGTAIEEVYILMYPKFFTPNQDGYNDTWSIKNSEKENLVTKIFDRYGKLIIILQPNQSWDGTLNGKKLPSSDYWFVVIRANGKEYKGHFTLKR